MTIYFEIYILLVGAVVADNSLVDTERWIDGDDGTCEEVQTMSTSNSFDLLFILPSTFQKVTDIRIKRPSTTPDLDISIENDTSSVSCLTGVDFSFNNLTCLTPAYGQYVRIRSGASYQLCEVTIYGEGEFMMISTPLLVFHPSYVFSDIDIIL